MKKMILGMLLLLFFGTANAEEPLKIISRSEWGADESYRYINSDVWKEIFENDRKKEVIPLTEEQKAENQKKQAKRNKINDILMNDFYNDQKLVSIQKNEGDNTLYWPISKTKQIHSLVIHHTYSDYEDSYEGIRKIYKYHSLNRRWGDIGYNFLIGKNGEIFEGRAGGADTVAAHNLYNNRSTIGIAVIGDYSHEPISQVQYESLKKLSKYLIKKYDINLNKEVNYHEECLWGECSSPLKSYKLPAIIGHRDASSSSCPGDSLYLQIAQMRGELIRELGFVNINKQKLFQKFKKLSESKLFDILVQIERYLEKNKGNKSNTYFVIDALKSYVLDYLTDGVGQSDIDLENEFIKVRLSYPHKNSISIKKGDTEVSITKKGRYLMVNGSLQSSFRIQADLGAYLEITSWERVPTWDTNKIYNDNKFRGEVIVYVKDEELVVVNKVHIDDYLKGLGEVSNGDHPQKIETIIIAARTYALWYANQARKFPGEWYDASDDPNVFQKYLGYSLEKRSPKINKIVEKTKGKVITYNGELIKPWYFSNSNGKTRSFYDYCMLGKNSEEFCRKEAGKYPYLSSVSDIASLGKQRYGHSVGISGLGSTYFAERGWNSENIIKYFLRGVRISSL